MCKFLYFLVSKSTLVSPLLSEEELRDTFGKRNPTHHEKAFMKTVRPGHMLVFATRSSKVPAIGLHQTPKLVHDESKSFPIAHVCK